MHALDVSVRACPRPALRGLIAASLLHSAAPGCGPSTNPGATDTGPQSTSEAEAQASTSGPGPTDPGGLNSDTSVSATGPTATTDGPACPTILCPDAGSHGAACDAFAQDCPDGQKCAAVIIDGGGAWNSTRCVPVTGDDRAGDSCTAESVADGLDSCAKGNMCWEVDGDGNGTCIELCMGTIDAPTCPDMGLCTVANDNVLNLCLPDCDPVLQDCTGPSQACYPSNDAFVCSPTTPDATGTANVPCTFIDECASGFLCVQAALVGAGCTDGWPGCCTPFCEFPGGKCPNPDQQCVQWYDPKALPPGDPKLHIGTCGLPQ